MRVISAVLLVSMVAAQGGACLLDASDKLKWLLQAYLGGNANPSAGDVNKILGSGQGVCWSPQ